MVIEERRFTTIGPIEFVIVLQCAQEIKDARPEFDGFKDYENREMCDRRKSRIEIGKGEQSNVFGELFECVVEVVRMCRGS